MINDLLLSTSSVGAKRDDANQTSNNSKDNAIQTNPASQSTNFINILVHEGLVLILNVLNNAITLHKRVSGSKQSCLPSKR